MLDSFDIYSIIFCFIVGTRVVKKLFKNDLILKSLLSMFTQGLGQLTALVTTVLLTNHLNQTQFGQWAFATITTATVLATIATFGAGGGVLSKSWGWTQKQGIERSKYVFNIMNGYLHKGTIFLLLVGVIFAGYCLWFPSRFNNLELYASLFMFPYFFANLIQAYYVSEKRVSWANLNQLCLRLIILACVGYYIFKPNTDFSSIVFMMLVILSCFTILVYILNANKLGYKSVKSGNNDNLSFMVLHWGNLLFLNVSPFILKIFCSDTDIGIYNVANQIVVISVFFAQALSANTRSLIAYGFKHHSKEVFQKNIHGYAKLMFFFSISIIFIIYLTGYWFVKIYSEGYYLAYPLSCVLLLGSLSQALCGGLTSQILNMSGHEKKTAKSFWYALVAMLLLGSSLAKFFGIWGVAISYAIVFSCWNVYLLTLVRKELQVNPTMFKFLNLPKSI